MMPIICWTRYFLLSQGYGIIENLLLQDNKSSILLERNGRASSGKRTRHINIRYFFITDRVNKKLALIGVPPRRWLLISWPSLYKGVCSKKLRDYIMGRVRCIKPKSDVVSLGRKKASKKLVKKSKVNGKRRITVTGSKKCAKVMPQ